MAASLSIALTCHFRYYADSFHSCQGAHMPASARHILVDTEVLCLQLKIEIEAGADFAAVAKRKSSCTSRYRGGDLGAFRQGQMAEEFDEAVFSGELNKLLGPVKTRHGYHLIEVTSRW
jgi:peptidyl-prolyl cis-trans isomerase C